MNKYFAEILDWRAIIFASISENKVLANNSELIVLSLFQNKGSIQVHLYSEPDPR